MKALLQGRHIWWQKPRIRTDADEEVERKASWLELFFDLMFVSIFAELSHFLHLHHTTTGIIAFALLFLMIWWMWNGLTFYNERYEVNDVRHRLFIFFSMLPLAGMAFSIEGAFEEKANIFIFCNIASRCFLAFMWLTAGTSGIEKKLSKTFTAGLLLSTALLIASVFVPGAYKFIFWSLAILVDYTAPLFSVKTQVKLPRISASHLPERFGLLVILAIGETVISSVKGLSEFDNLTMKIAVNFSLSFAVSFIIWWLYVDHVLNRTFPPAIWHELSWCYLHAPLTLCIIAIGSGLHGVVSLSETGILSDHTSWLLAGSVIAFLLVVASIEMVSKSPHQSESPIEYHRKLNLELLTVKIVCIIIILAIVSFAIEKLTSSYLLATIVIAMAVPAIHGLNVWVKASLKNQPSLVEASPIKKQHVHDHINI